MSNSVVELFAGVGGFHLAAKQSGWNVIWANQWEPGVKVQHAFDCYTKNFPDTVEIFTPPFSITLPLIILIIPPPSPE